MNTHTLSFLQDLQGDARKMKYLGVGFNQLADMMQEASLVDDSDYNQVSALLKDILANEEALKFLGMRKQRVIDMLSEFGVLPETLAPTIKMAVDAVATATQKASEASQSAVTATQKASQASQSAATATQKASQASQSAVTAASASEIVAEKTNQVLEADQRIQSSDFNTLLHLMNGIDHLAALKAINGVFIA